MCTPRSWITVKIYNSKIQHVRRMWGSNSTSQRFLQQASWLRKQWTSPNEIIYSKLFMNSLHLVRQTRLWQVDRMGRHDSTLLEQYKFNKKVDPTMLNLLKLKKLSHESFEEYVIRWRMEASKIRHLPHEEELVKTLIRSLKGIYYKTCSSLVFKVLTV